MVFYSLPEHPQFYADYLNALETGRTHGARRASAIYVLGAGENSVVALWSQQEALALERIVGSERAARMLRADQVAHIFCSGA